MSEATSVSPATDDGGEKEEEEECRSKKEEEELKETGEKSPRDTPASSGSKPGRSNDEMDTREEYEWTGGGSGGGGEEVEEGTSQTTRRR